MRGDALPREAADDARQRRLAQALRAALLAAAQHDTDETQRQLTLERALAVAPGAADLARALRQVHPRSDAQSVRAA